MKIPVVLVRAFFIALCFASRLPAQLSWKSFDETASTAVSGSAGKTTVTVPAGQRVTLYSTNFVPLDLSVPGTSVVSLNVSASGGLSSISSGTRAIGVGLFNHAASSTDTNFAADSGYFFWANGRSTGSNLIEQRKKTSTGAEPSLLNPDVIAFNALGTGVNIQTAGTLSDNSPYGVQLRLVRTASGIALGTSSSTTATAGIWLSGEGISQLTYSSVDSSPAGGGVYNLIAVYYFNSTAAPVTLTVDSVTGVTPINAPAIVTQPQPLSLNPGQTGVFTVVATGTPPLSYQWSKDGSVLVGSTAATYSIPSADDTSSGSYSVVVKNVYGSGSSDAALLTVTPDIIPATIQTSPASLTVATGQSASFSVAAFGSDPVTYQWNKDAVPILGANSSTLSLASTTASDAGDYTVTVANSAITVVSAAATLTVNVPPSIASQPVNATVNAGDDATFSVVAAGIPAPTYQWRKNGTNIAGATAASLTLSHVSLADVGAYTVKVSNLVGSAVSSPAVLAIPSSMVATSHTPDSSVAGLNPDVSLSITFDRAPAIGITGRIQIVNATTSAVVDTIDLASTTQTRLIGTQPVPFNYFPVLINGNTAAIYPHSGVLAYGQTYYVTVEPGALRDTTGASFTGIAGAGTWTFATKASGPDPTASAVTVAANGSGDFNTVQGAIDFVPSGNTQRVTINVKKGIYNELNFVGATKTFITIHGEDRTQTVITYPNNSNFNGSVNGFNRVMFATAANDFTIENLTLRNSTPRGGSQAEAFGSNNAQRVIVSRCNIYSLQDTMLLNGLVFVTDCYVEGDVDFMWGNGTAYFQRCELKAVNAGFYTQIRSTQTTKGNVYVDCRLTAPDGLTGVYLGRIDPTTGQFPYSQVVWINCSMGPHIVPEGWQLNNATSAPNVSFWEYRSTDLLGIPLDVSKRLKDSTQIDEATAAQYRDPAFVLNGWTPMVTPTIEQAPLDTAARFHSTIKLTAVVAGAPQPTLQWYKNGVPIAWATNPVLALQYVKPSAAAVYTLVATNALGDVSTSATVTVNDVQPAITAPLTEGSMASTSAELFAPEVLTSNSFDNPTGLLSGLEASASGLQSFLSGFTLLNGATTASFVVSGATPGRVLIRAVGSSLASLGLAGSNAAPRLELYQDSQLIGSNTGWMTALNASDIVANGALVGASPLAQSGTDSALYQTLAPGTYTASVSSPLDFSSSLSTPSNTVVIEVYQFP